jgi:hypothetical protein
MVRSLHEEVMRNRLSQEERNRIEAEIRAATLALTHYKAAFDLERSLNLS